MYRELSYINKFWTYNHPLVESSDYFLQYFRGYSPLFYKPKIKNLIFCEDLIDQQIYKSQFTF